MESIIAKEIKLRYEPIAIIFTDEKPVDALQFKEGKWGCAITMMTAAAKGRIAVFDRTTKGCLGGGTGLGFGNYDEFPGGIEYFVSTGRGEGFREGEHYKKTPEAAKDMFDKMPFTEIPYKYVVFKPLSKADEKNDNVVLIVFYATADQLSALTVLANYRHHDNNHVIVPFGAGCHSVCLIPYMQAKNGEAKAVLGMLDVSARPQVDADLLSLSVPIKMFHDMEEDAPGSFLHHKAWLKVKERIK
jgi:uncharacterized protein (DUF169 family)